MNPFEFLGMHWFNLNLWWHYTISVINFLVNHFPIQWLLMSLLVSEKFRHNIINVKLRQEQRWTDYQRNKALTLGQLIKDVVAARGGDLLLAIFSWLQ
ncbi:hypothetical protein HCG51_10605 [Tolypothrix sp. PCC 7910]|uniref:hypothetical protein n=1 Tax=Tolypothrix sp. PCC 7910 TaxID=2099387 RepID=UPI001427986D|nr:hypothetical protein [Tolypothrix sp. PCC 7910]QIR37131.1 hypothetical protein HCG51_10605 [Tolypothrix sp. PCC 7910]